MKDRHDLFQKTQNNAISIEIQYNKIKYQPGIIEFAEYVQKYARVSVNRHAQPLLDLLRENILLSGYRDAERRGENFKDYLRRKWLGTPPKFIQRRIVFSRTFSRGEDIMFGALNAGGAGTAAKNGAYGYYCIVLKETIDNKNVIYSKRDTLAEDLYWTCSKKNPDGSGCPCRGSLDELECQVSLENLLPDYAPHSHRGCLAAIKCQSRIIKGLSNDAIAKLLIETIPRSTEEYIEACFLICFSRDLIEEVRFHKSMVVEIFDEALLDPNNLPRKASFIRQHQQILALLIKNDIPFAPGD